MRIFIYIVFIGSLLFTLSCGNDNEVRKYSEKNPNDNIGKMKKIYSPHSEMKIEKKPVFDWNIPKGWTIGKNTSSIRVATFNIKSDNDTAICTIVPLLGNGGGLIPNVELWLKQLGINLSNKDEKFQSFLKNSIKFKTDGGLEGIIIDTTVLQKNDTDNSILAALIKLKDKTVFFKLRGKLKTLKENREKFIALCKSFKEQK